MASQQVERTSLVRDLRPSQVVAGRGNIEPLGEEGAPVEPKYFGRSGPRSLGAAEGVLVALRRCSLDEAFIDIVQTAKRHNVAPLGLADALVAIAENDITGYFDDHTVAAADRAWGALLGRSGGNTALGISLRGPTAGTQDEERQL